MPFAFFIAVTDTPYFLAIVDRLSPDLTLWDVVARLFFTGVAFAEVLEVADAAALPVTAATVLSITASGLVVDIRSC